MIGAAPHLRTEAAERLGWRGREAFRAFNGPAMQLQEGGIVEDIGGCARRNGWAWEAAWRVADKSCPSRNLKM